MTLLSRYVGAIRAALPKENADDVAADRRRITVAN